MRNTIYGTHPILFHANGPKPHEHAQWFADQLYFLLATPRARVECPEITVYAWSNRPNEEPFETCCKHFGIPCRVIGREYPEWSNRYKIDSAVKALESCTTKYFLAADASDVLLIGDIRALALPKACTLLFNAENNHFPPDTDTFTFEKAVSTAPFQFLNSGICFGETKRCVEFFRHAMNLCVADDWGSDQRVWKMCYRDFYPFIQVDDHCRLFQSIRGVNPNEILSF